MVDAPTGATVVMWYGTNTAATTSTGQQLRLQPTGATGEEPSITVFTRRGDHQSTGWLATYRDIRI